MPTKVVHSQFQWNVCIQSWKQVAESIDTYENVIMQFSLKIVPQYMREWKSGMKVVLL